MTMQCENGYIKDGVRGILCRKAEEPKNGDLGGIAHALCGQQRFCPNARCFQMLSGWEACPKRRESRVEAEGREIPAKAGKSTGKKKRAQNA